MSLELNTDNSYIRRTGEANLGSVASGTYLGWYFKNDSTNGDDVFSLGISGNGGVFRTISATQMRALLSVGGGATFTANNSEWIGIAVTVSSGTFTLYTYQAGTLTQQYTESVSSANVSGLYCGQDGGFYTSARGCHRYQRYWAGRVLNSTEIEAEFEMTPSSGTPAASATNLYLSWPLADGTDTTDWTGNSRAPTISGAATSSEEPTIGGGTAPTITDAGDEQYYAGETGIVITGTNFGASQGSNGRVYLSPTDDVDDAGRVSQTITAWGATSITFTATLGSLSLDTNLYLFVLADSTESNAAGYVVQIVARPFIRDTLIGLNGAAVASETGMTMLVYHSVPATAVAPAQVITGVSTNGSGQLDQVINRGALALNAPVWLILMKDGSPAKATARKVTPVYE